MPRSLKNVFFRKGIPFGGSIAEEIEMGPISATAGHVPRWAALRRRLAAAVIGRDGRPWLDGLTALVAVRLVVGNFPTRLDWAHRS